METRVLDQVSMEEVHVITLYHGKRKLKTNTVIPQNTTAIVYQLINDGNKVMNCCMCVYEFMYVCV